MSGREALIRICGVLMYGAMMQSSPGAIAVAHADTMGRESAGNGPPLAIDLTYADQFPIANSLWVMSPVDVGSWLDVTWDDGDDTNAQLGDSAVVFAPGANTRVFLNFQVYPGPGSLDISHPFYSRYGGDFVMPGGSWAEARMDTAETAAGPTADAWATYLHESAGGVEGSYEYKLIPDGLLRPGTTVEYFFTADTGLGTPQTVSPDTSGGFHLEWQALPGYFGQGGDFLAPCVLYVDAYNQGAQTIIEDFGLAPYLGTETDDTGMVHDAWDRYDYVAVTTDLAAPLAREPAGDNGMTTYQSLIYRTILYNTGSHPADAIRNRDAELLTRWLTIDDFDRDLVRKSLWLSGDNVADMLRQSGMLDMNLLLAAYASAEVICDEYGHILCGGGGDGDPSACSRLDPTPGTIGSSMPYAAVSGSRFQDVIAPLGSAVGGLVYVDQDDAGQPVTEFASVYHDQFASSLSWAVMLDAFSLHKLRRVPADFADDACGSDYSAVTTRVSDVFGWMGVFPGVECSLCDFCVDCCVVLAGPHPPPAPPALTVLLQNAPNPFNPTTLVRYHLSERADVTVRIYNARGALVRTLVNEAQPAARYAVVWDGTNDRGESVVSGVYLAHMSTSDGFRASTKLVLLE